MKDIVIIGAGGMGKDIQWLIERINEVEETWNFIGYIDDGIPVGTIINDCEVLGGVEYLMQIEIPLAVVCSVANPKIREKIIAQIIDKQNFEFPNLIDPSVIMSKRVQMGIGNVICAGCTVSVNIALGDFDIICVDSTIGHDDWIDSYVTIYPSVNVSGHVSIGEKSEIGTGTQILQGLKIGTRSVVGAGTVVIREVEENCTVVGNPARVVKYL